MEGNRNMDAREGARYQDLSLRKDTLELCELSTDGRFPRTQVPQAASVLLALPHPPPFLPKILRLES